jgi:tagatose-1,6-bisphosphate aldolase
VLALDHRNNLRQAMRPNDPDSVSPQELSAFKIEVVRTLAPASTAVLLDPEFGAAQVIAAGAVPGQVGMLVAAEATGYTGDPTARQSRVLDGWSIAKIRRMGANAVKILAYYHPDAPTAGEVEAFVTEVAADCAAQDILLFLEPLSYSLDRERKKLPPEERRRVVLETARRLVLPGVDVLKAEFPLDIQAVPDESAWIEACTELSAASPAPWVLLSASVDYETFLRQVSAACRGGASGVAVGRAVWQEAAGMDDLALRTFLRDIAFPRMARVTFLCEALARPWTEIYSPTQVEPGWYRQYANPA